MDTIWIAIKVWIGWTIAPFLILIIILLLFVIRSTIKQYRCNHSKVRESRACHAICKSCGKDLGFIGTWRELNETHD